MAAHDALLSHLCSSRECRLGFATLMCCAAVSRSWRNAILSGLPMLHVLDFRDYEARLTGADVLRALERVAGVNLRSLDLSGCCLLSGADMAQIMGVVRASCGHAQATVVVSGCSDEARLSAVAECAQSVLGAASPRALFELLATLHDGASRCPDAVLRERLQEGTAPYITLGAEFAPRRRALSTAAEHGSVWIVALLLGVAYAVGNQGEIRTFDCNKRNRNGQRPIHFAAAQGNEAMLAVLVSAGADLNPSDDDGNTPLLAASAGGYLELVKVLIDAGADISAANREGNTPLLAASEGGHLELAKMLIDAGAGVSAADKQGNTPLLAASAGRHFELCKVLIDVGANVEATRTDGASLLAFAIVSQKQEFVNFAFQHGPTRLEGQGSSCAASDVAQFSQIFLDPSQIGNWLQCGASLEGLIGEIGALLSSAFVDQLVKGKLENVRAFISHHKDVLHDPSRWPVLHFVEQLASQETDNTFQSAPTGAQVSGHLEENVDNGAFIQRVNPRQERRAYKWMMRGDAEVKVIAFSPDGSRLARAEGTLVVVCDTTTGFVECTLTGHASKYVFFGKFFCFSVSVDSCADFSQLQGDVGCMEQGWQAGQRQL